MFSRGQKKSSCPLATILCIELVNEIVSVSLVLLSNFIVENLKFLSMLWSL
jgi:hypothetical protein